VLYIGGWGRSGSTLLARLLGELPGFVAVGEIHFLFTRGVAGNQLCGCGASFRECPFWQAVGTSAFGGWKRVDVNALMGAGREVDRLRRLHLLSAPRLSRAFAERLSFYSDAIRRVYRAIDELSGGSVIVDSSKAPHFALVARRAEVDLRILHLVRDSRAVAYSWKRTKARPEPIDGQPLMDRYRPSKSAYRWALDNALFDAMAAAGAPRLVVRYESLAASPGTWLERIAEFAGRPLEGGDLNFVEGRSVRLGLHHTVAGNPNRLERGVVEITPDEEWRRHMTTRDRRTVTALTLPLLVRYGYLRSSRA
jgi:hypothetical protein